MLDKPYHAQIAKGLLEAGNDVHFFAPQGSEPIGIFHPLACYNGGYPPEETITGTSLEGLKTEYIIEEKFDFVIDFSAIAMNIEELNQFHGFTKYAVFRNGYTGFNVPRLSLKYRHYCVPSIQNQRIFKAHGFDSKVAYYPIPDFYKPPSSKGVVDHMFADFFISNGIKPQEYFLYPHRPTKEKGSLNILELAKTFPQETFVFMVSNNPVMDHKNAIQILMKTVQVNNINNIKFVELPLTNLHHYYKRALMQHAKAILSPFNPHEYKEGFGLSNAEPVACGTPILITDSDSSRELWIDGVDGLIIPYEDRLWGFKMAIKHFDSYRDSFSPKNRYTTEKSISNWQNIMEGIMNNV